MKKTTKIALIVAGIAVVVCAVIVAVAILVDNVEQLVLGMLPSEHTEKYSNYVCIDPNLTFVKSKATRLREYMDAYSTSPEYNDSRFEYYQIDGFHTNELIGARVTIQTLFRNDTTGLILIDPQHEFSTFNDWSVKKISIMGGGDILSSCESSNVLASFSETAKYATGLVAQKYNSGKEATTAETHERVESETNQNLGDPIDRASYGIEAVFNETEIITWEADVFITVYEGDLIYMGLRVDYFDYYPRKQTEYVNIPEGTPLYDYILNVYRSRK